MKKLPLMFLICIMACSSAPTRPCKTILWEMLDKPCLTRIDDDDNEIVSCPGDENYPDSVISITISDYTCERDFQSTLKHSCKKWRKN